MKSTRCLPGNLPAFIEIDLSTLKTFEDSITLSGLNLPEGVEVLEDDDLTIVNVARPLTEDELKALEESQIGDVAAVVAKADEEKAEEEAGKEGDEKKAEASADEKSGEAGTGSDKK